MTCKDFEKQIPAFLERELDFLTLKQFCEHMETCSECHEELVIQFLVTEGMLRLEEGDAFDLQTELESRLAEAKNRVKFRSVFLYLGAGLKTLAIALVVGFLLWIFL